MTENALKTVVIIEISCVRWNQGNQIKTDLFFTQNDWCDR